MAEKSKCRAHSACIPVDVPWETASTEAKSRSVEKACEDCLLVCNMIAPESGAKLYKALTSQHGMKPSSDLEALNDGLQKCQDLKAQDTDPQYIRIQAFNSHTNEASRTVRKARMSSSEASKKTCETAWSWNHSRKRAKVLYVP